MGTGNIACFRRKYRPFGDARDFAQKLKLKSSAEWISFCKGRMPHKGKLPADIPARPSNTYAAKGWNGYGDWLGTGTIATNQREYRPFSKARGFAQKLNLNNTSEWRDYCKGKIPQKGKLPADIPTAPWQTYANKGWKGYGDWLGTGRTRRTKH